MLTDLIKKISKFLDVIYKNHAAFYILTAVASCWWLRSLCQCSTSCSDVAFFGSKCFGVLLIQTIFKQFCLFSISLLSSMCYEQIFGHHHQNYFQNFWKSISPLGRQNQSSSIFRSFFKTFSFYCEFFLHLISLTRHDTLRSCCFQALGKLC